MIYKFKYVLYYDIFRNFCYFLFIWFYFLDGGNFLEVCKGYRVIEYYYVIVICLVNFVLGI